MVAARPPEREPKPTVWDMLAMLLVNCFAVLCFLFMLPFVILLRVLR